MVDRVIKNEERFDRVLESVKKLEDGLTSFNNTKKDLLLLKKYYNSKNWIKDKDLHEDNKLKIKAGVLSEDGVWNMLELIDELMNDMKRIITEYGNNK